VKASRPAGGDDHRRLRREALERSARLGRVGVDPQHMGARHVLLLAAVAPARRYADERLGLAAGALDHDGGRAMGARRDELLPHAPHGLSADLEP